MSEKVSAATIRNVMQDLEYLGLLDSPHVVRGRVPTQEWAAHVRRRVLEVGDLDRMTAISLDATLESNSADMGGAGPVGSAPVGRDAGGVAWCSRRNMRRRSSTSSSCPCRPTGRSSCWCSRMDMSRTGSSRRRPGQPQFDAGGREFPERAIEGQDAQRLRGI
jgi:hypothetical protein